MYVGRVCLYCCGDVGAHRTLTPQIRTFTHTHTHTKELNHQRTSIHQHANASTYRAALAKKAFENLETSPIYHKFRCALFFSCEFIYIFIYIYIF